ncbi:DUF5753 domain-containing protein [Amycolatopsis sp.]|uniref:DUF5753 domain-containing protein n=1 Tax=Amycolatopsis sp. TaxID=37632 RepID=UPI00261C17C0|nr:DUF5753 domain-containing protein [Amycolatopsis sp.]
MPGLLQIPAYTSAIAVSSRRLGPKTEDWQARAALERSSRQTLLDGENPLRLHILLSEAVISIHVGGRQVMADQLRHLLLMSARSNVTIQVIPFTAGAISNMSGPFTILEFDDEIDKHTTELIQAALDKLED